MTQLAALQRQLKTVAADLRGQAEAVPKLKSWLETQYKQAYGKRTGATYEAWREEQLDQAAVAWVLGTVFVRFCEDNDLIDRPFIAGPGQRTDEAVEAATEYFLEHPTDNDRHWIRQAFTHLASLRATTALFDEHNPIWRWDLSADAATGLLDFWRRGAGVHDYTSSDLDTRFLGDLYEKLSLDARKRYALLQTPDFVEEFILKLTLDESIKDYGLEDTSLIDPTCGSGHFLLGAFHRLLPLWELHHPDLGRRERAQRVLDQITGVDINPFAIAIARFRLLVEVLRYCDEKHLADSPGFSMRLAAGDSLLRWGDDDSSHQGDLLHLLETGEAYAYYTEDAPTLKRLLKPAQYTAVVGNPPYIAVNDKYLNDLYRDMYETCSGKYALTVPFAERFFELARKSDTAGRAGIIGQITSNSFMKREFGKKLVTEFFAKKVELCRVIDTSGAYIPGHGTPTVILIGYRRPTRRSTVRAVLGVQGERGVPENPATAPVWSSISEGFDSPGSSNGYVTVVDAPIGYFLHHPWSLAGGGASDVQAQIEAGSSLALGAISTSIGITSFTLEDDLFVQSPNVFRRQTLPTAFVRPMVRGDGIRDWALEVSEHAIFPYDPSYLPVDIVKERSLLRFMWPSKTCLSNSMMFGKRTKVDAGLLWTEYGRLTASKLAVPLSIGFAFVATHNQFVLDGGGKSFNRTSPVIKLPASANEDDHLELLGLLNSSTACFWLKQVSHDKGIRGEGGGFTSSDWERFFEFTGTKLLNFPVPSNRPLGRARRLDQLARRLSAVRPSAVFADAIPTRSALDAAHAEYDRAFGADGSAAGGVGLGGLPALRPPR